MQLDPAAYLRARRRRTASARPPPARRSRRRPATSSRSGASARACSALRVGPNTRPDYGIVVGRAQRCAVAQRAPGTWTFTAGDAIARNRRRAAARPAGVEGRAGARARSPTSISAAGRGCRRSAACAQGGLWTAAFALASGEPVYGLGEKFGPLNKRGQLDPFAGRGRARRQHRPRLQEHAVRVEPRHAARARGACSCTRPAW